MQATIITLLAAAAFACDSGTNDGGLPPEIPDPTTLRTPAGAIARYRGTFKVFGAAMDRFVIGTGVLSDEMTDLPVPFGSSGRYTDIDSHTNLDGFEEHYKWLHLLRAEAREARGFLTSYAPDSSAALPGHLYAVEAYADVLLADLFCSGIPLSTVEFDGNYTLRAGSTTQEVYSAALALFDSAAALVSDSVQLQSFVAVGRGRALLALKQYAEAAVAVAAVPDEYRYLLPVTSLETNQASSNLTLEDIFFRFTSATTRDLAAPGVGNLEGGNGLDYRTSDDPRIGVQAVASSPDGYTLWFPTQYPFTGTTVEILTLASGIEARLIEAEAALRANPGDGAWLVKLNTLRTDGTYDVSGTTPPDTSWHAGAGGVAGLRPLEDPGTETGRVSLLFRERAFWLFLTGHRQGDLRRLVRDYGRSPNTVYPTGGYSGGTGVYGDQVFAQVPESERKLNPEYRGCLSQP